MLAAERIDARHIRDGALGCPVCRAEYPIRNGIADFTFGVQGEASRAQPPRAPADAIAGVGAGDLAALLDLGDALGFAVLVGAWGHRAVALLELDVVPPLLVVDPPEGVAIVSGMSGVRSGPSLPIAAGAARAIAVDGTDTERLASAVRVARTGGRIVAPATMPVPDGVRELARSEAVWVGEREAPPSAFVRLHVRRG